MHRTRTHREHIKVTHRVCVCVDSEKLFQLINIYNYGETRKRTLQQALPIVTHQRD